MGEDRQTDVCTILAFVVSTLIIYGHGENFVKQAGDCWEKEGVIVFCAKATVYIGAFVCCFAAVVHLWMKAAQSAIGDSAQTKPVAQSLVIICGGYIAIHCLQSPVVGMKEFFSLLIKSTTAALVWVGGVYEVYAVVPGQSWHPRDGFKPLAGAVFLFCYSAGIISYIKQGWAADMSFLYYWFQVAALAELPIAFFAAVYSLTTFLSQEKFSIAIVAVFSTVVMYISSYVSAYAHEPDGCSFTCGFKLEFAAFLFACGCALIVYKLREIFSMELNKFKKILMLLLLLVAHGYLILIAHGYRLPKWIEICNIM